MDCQKSTTERWIDVSWHEIITISKASTFSCSQQWRKRDSPKLAQSGFIGLAQFHLKPVQQSWKKKKKSPWYWMRLRILCNIIYDWLFSVRGGKQERRKNFLLQSFCDDFYYGIYSTSLLPQRHVKDPGHSAKSAGRWQVTANHLCKPLTQRSRSGLLCRPLIV